MRVHPCGKQDRQVFVSAAPRYDPNYILRTAHSRMTACKTCNPELPKNLELEVDICPSTREELRKSWVSCSPNKLSASSAQGGFLPVSNIC
jgi:hypothetical protein